MRAIPFVSLLAVAPLAAQTVVPQFNAHFSVRTVGPIAPGLGGYGGICLKHNDPNVLLYSPFGGTTIWAVPLTRDSLGHIQGFGTATIHATLTDPADGGLAFGPNNVLFHTSYPANRIGEVLPGSGGTNRTLDLDVLSGSTFASVGSCAFVPPGYPGAGQFKVVSWFPADWRTVSLAAEPSGTFGATSISGPLLIGGGPEGIVYPSGGSSAWPDGSRVLLADWSNNQIRVLQIDANGDPIPGTDAVLVDNAYGPGGGAVDPLTGDMVFTLASGELLQLRHGGTCGSFRVYGLGGAGLTGVPVIAGNGCARLAGSFAVDVGNGRPGAPGAMLVGFSEWNLPVFNFALLNDAPISLPHVLTPTGAYGTTLQVPSASNYGNADVYFQGVWIDAAGPFGLAASRGLHVHID